MLLPRGTEPNSRRGGVYSVKRRGNERRIKVGLNCHFKLLFLARREGRGRTRAYMFANGKKTFLKEASIWKKGQIIENEETYRKIGPFPSGIQGGNSFSKPKGVPAYSFTSATAGNMVYPFLCKSRRSLSAKSK